MKKQLTVALGLAVLATPAFATKARLLALGEDVYGSAYINDNRNIWLNAAQINNHKDLVTYEFGANGNSATTDSSATSRGEGGLYKSFGNMVYGLHFGSQSNTANALRAGAGLFSNAGGTAGSAVNEENNIDGFVGGDAGVKWGVNLGYARTKNDETAAVKTRGESLRTRLGVIMGDTQAYANINLINNAKGQNAAGGASTFEGKMGYQVGAIHAWEGNTLFADWRQFDAKADAGQGNDNIKLKQGYIGIGRVERLNDKTNLFMKAQYLMADTKNNVFTGALAGLGAGCSGAETATVCNKYKTNRVPVTIGLETEATSWLTLRASVSQVVWGNEKVNSNDRGVRNSTGINAGATLKFGELSVDGVIGNAVGGDVAGSGAASNSTAAGNGTLRTDVLMSRVGMTYRF